jgi:hypothetical protein
MARTENAEIEELVSRPREALDIEVKNWLNLSDPDQRCVLAKALIAIANHGGGYLVLGFEENSSGQFAPDKNRPGDLKGYSQDRVQDVISRCAEPAFQCEVIHQERSDRKGIFPVVVIPGGHRVPIKSKAGSPDGKTLIPHRVYMRRPGPKSEEPQNAAEWDALFERCLRTRKDELLDGIRDLLSGQVPSVVPSEPSVADRLSKFTADAENRWSERVRNVPAGAGPRFPQGYYAAALALDGDFPLQNAAEFRNAFRGALQDHSGWPPFVYIDNKAYRPSLVDGAIEAWFGPDENGQYDKPSRSDFWRAAPEGLFYTRRGYNEDGHFRGIEPGTTFDITTPTWRIGEILLQTLYVATALGAANANLLVRLQWTGLADRELVSIGNPNRFLSAASAVAHQSNYTAEKVVRVARIYDGLPEILFEILEPLYQLFDFWRLPKRLVEEEIRALKKGRF